MGHEPRTSPETATHSTAAVSATLCAWPQLHELVDEVVGARRAAAAAQATEARLLARAVDLISERIEIERQRWEAELAAGDGSAPRRALGSDLPLREVALELGMAMRVSDRTLQARMGDAWRLVEGFPQTLSAWESGTIDAGHAWAITRAGMSLAESDRARFEALALSAAAEESVGRFVPLVRSIAAAVDPLTFAEECADGVGERRVRVYPIDNGLARLVADLPAPLAYAILDRLTQAASRALSAPPIGHDHDAISDVPHANDGTEPIVTGPCRSTRPGTAPEPDRRTTDQVRADMLADLLLTAAPTCHGDAMAGVTGHVQVTIPALALAGVAVEPALMAGYGPVEPDFVRRLAAKAPGWDRVFTDPYTGVPLAIDRYRPNAQLIRYLDARDERCRTPTCQRAAMRCDKDHTIDAARGGTTEADNLASFCRRHHVGKHQTAWRVRQLGGGVIEWTSPTGRRHRDRPPAAVRFVPAADGDPPF